jgi:hypothetical protein
LYNFQLTSLLLLLVVNKPLLLLVIKPLLLLNKYLCSWMTALDQLQGVGVLLPHYMPGQSTESQQKEGCNHQDCKEAVV